MAWRRAQSPALITSARISTSLDTEQRSRRYLITMGIRVLCFVTGIFAPLPWNLVLLAGAAILPAIAVVLANAVDLRTPPPEDDGSPEKPALTSGTVVTGDVSPGEPGPGQPDTDAEDPR